MAILQLAGVDMMQETLSQWVRLANGVASFLTGADYSSAAVSHTQEGPHTHGKVRSTCILKGVGLSYNLP